jgi:hypothetical protein
VFKTDLTSSACHPELRFFSMKATDVQYCVSAQLRTFPVILEHLPYFIRKVYLIAYLCCSEPRA